ncbi:MAG: cupin domain-containing protein [Saprospiraceae bacterium]|nr:cupin domain-containing protein [Saprospiraceae bacterium]
MKTFLLTILIISFNMEITAQTSFIDSGIFQWKNLDIRESRGRQYRKVLEGKTDEFSFFEIHVSTQFPGAQSRPPHTQADIEELIIVKEGILTCILDGKSKDLSKGSVILVPPGVEQSMFNTHDVPVTYYVIMFKAAKAIDMMRSDKAGGALMIEASELVYTDKGDKGSIQYFDRPTATTENFEMHITKLKKQGPSHSPHSHVDTEIILVNEGQVSMTIDGKSFLASEGDILFARSGSFHGVSNATDEACAYFAFKWR